MSPTWIPLTLAVLTAAALGRFFWLGSRERVSPAYATVTSALIIGLVLSVRLTIGADAAVWTADDVNRTVRNGFGDSLLSGDAPSNESSSSDIAAPERPAEVTSPPVSVQGAVETRDTSDRVVACETALAAIADAVRTAAADTGADMGNLSNLPSTAAGEDARPDEQRLASCEVRLRSIAATLPG